ncbi:MAG: DUF1553 domain-containing protein [Verrucomicrobiaceae bacterium]|nr:DUF1553 domain-containing protein [Verrucomicrobiaceae bacterium]
MLLRRPAPFLRFAACLLCAGGSLGGVDFEGEIAPLFARHCLDCHDTATREGGIGLETHHHAHLPTDDGEAIFTPGDPDASVLLRVVTESDPEKRMPLREEPLSAEEIALLRRWIEEGAEWPDDGWRPARHWAYLAPKRIPPPADAASFPPDRHPNEIDFFILAELEKNGLALNPEAAPANLLRRVCLDITGLPPSREQREEFLADPSFARYTRLVDELLASPAYGEKWAVPWLDLARYADSEGYQRDTPRNMWPWRDWVIAALNEDKPFDQFTIEQLAGDLLPDATESQKIATAFHRNTPLNLEAGTDPEEDHYKQIVDRVNTTGTIWLGSTVGCAQCHNHKYDPLSTREYYELFAFFNNTPMESRQEGEEMGMSNMIHIGPVLEVTRNIADIDAELAAEAEHEAVLDTLRADILQAVETRFQKDPEARETLSDEVKIILALDRGMSLKQCRTLTKQLDLKLPGLQRRFTEAETREARLTEQRKKEVRVMEELPAARATFVAKRGDFLSRGEKVSPATPAALHPFRDDFPRNRLGLAQWLVDPANPLVARAYINRLWIEIFGEGLVTTPDDFGPQGERPSHPQLLDALAVAFVEEDAWSMKQALRRVLLSATYRQSVVVNETAAVRDPRNRWLWRHPGHRLSAEMIRDQALAVSGLLSSRLYGISVRPHQPAGFWRKGAGASETSYLPSRGEDAHRRGVYTLWRRNAHYPSFANFDAPDRSVCIVQREVSNTPLQALTLLNDPVYLEIAAALADRIRREGGDTHESRMEWAFRTVLTRAPNEPEEEWLRSAFARVRDASGSEENAWREIATILLNLHETITRP